MILNAGTVVSKLYTILSPFIDARTASKLIILVSSLSPLSTASLLPLSPSHLSPSLAAPSPICRRLRPHRIEPPSPSPRAPQPGLANDRVFEIIPPESLPIFLGGALDVAPEGLSQVAIGPWNEPGGESG